MKKAHNNISLQYVYFLASLLFFRFWLSKLMDMKCTIFYKLMFSAALVCILVINLANSKFWDLLFTSYYYWLLTIIEQAYNGSVRPSICLSVLSWLNHLPVLVWVYSEDQERSDKQIDKRTDRRYQVHYLPTMRWFAVDNNDWISILVFVMKIGDFFPGCIVWKFKIHYTTIYNHFYWLIRLIATNLNKLWKSTSCPHRLQMFLMWIYRWSIVICIDSWFGCTAGRFSFVSSSFGPKLFNFGNNW